MKLTMDLESRSNVDLVKCGMFRYAEDESTDIMCFAFKIDNLVPDIWVPKKFVHLITDEYLKENLLDDEGVKAKIKMADIIEAHNAGFEAVMWHEIMHKRYGFPDLPFEKLRCSAAKAATYSLPRALVFACKAMKVNIQKDMDGRRIMMKMCKPRKPRKAEMVKGVTGLLWHEDPADFDILVKYCMQDVEAEHAFSNSIPDLTEEQLEVWRLDQKINKRGIQVDVKAIDNLMEKVEEKSNRLKIEAQALTGGIAVSQVSALRDWAGSKGVVLKDLTAETVKEAIRDGVPEDVKRVLEIRQSISKASVAKLAAMKRMACKDGRVRGSILYHGARTGRFSGRGLQPHNMLRNSYDTKTINEILNLDNELIEFLYDCPVKVASKCTRGMLTAGPGKKLYCSDWNAIEGRILAWLAGEHFVLEGYRKGLDPYKVAAAPIFEKSYEEIDDGMERQVGKVIELSCGYQGYVGAFAAMASSYGLSYPSSQREYLAAKLIGNEEKVTESALFKEWAAPLIMAWRKSRPNTVAYWTGVMNAATMAVKTGKPFAYGHVKFGMRGRFLHCRLPSGRLLSYCDPKIMMMTDKYKREKEIITFWGVASDKDKVIEGSKHWGRIATYGGKLTENIVQAVAADILTDGMLRHEREGYPVVMHVHDEVIAEMTMDTDNTLEEFENLMSVTPSWAKGLPLKAEGWEGHRYRK